MPCWITCLWAPARRPWGKLAAAVHRARGGGYCESYYEPSQRAEGRSVCPRRCCCPAKPGKRPSPHSRDPAPSPRTSRPTGQICRSRALCSPTCGDAFFLHGRHRPLIGGHCPLKLDRDFLGDLLHDQALLWGSDRHAGATECLVKASAQGGEERSRWIRICVTCCGFLPLERSGRGRYLAGRFLFAVIRHGCLDESQVSELPR